MHGVPQLPVEGELPSLGGATAWLNSEPLGPSELRGTVVLANFCTYSCINWIRQLPYVRAWAHKYGDRGLTVVGVHTPEFGFEHELGNVRRAIRDMGVDYPVALDSDYAIWNAFENEYWPALYFADSQGRLRHHHFGEGDYERSEVVIQRLLEEAGARGLDAEPVSVDARGVEAAADWNELGSPETYLGYARGERLAATNEPVLDRAHDWAAPRSLRLNEWALTGAWTLRAEAAELNGAEGRVAYRFLARDVNLVMAPFNRAGPARFQVLLDGMPPAAAHGLDIDEEGNGTAAEPRMYQLIRQPGPVAERTAEIAFLDPGIRAYVFTFG